ncbi:MAG: RnfABCDGE type electron transport complex subunit G [Bacteroidales bacterium]|nr:RnfABCDGE type electron transport complex subunit G [Bacteroidales bacterium]MBR4838041.1 RnfABCDGE type electron transport complex subunit G [Bacteroidales bacterium]
MAKKESTLVNMLIALMVITIVSGGVLGFVYGLTKPAIDQVEANKNLKAINEVLKTDVEIATTEAKVIEDLTYNLAYDANGDFIGAAVKTYSNNGFGGKVELMVGILKNGYINKVSVLAQAETPGLGANMTNEKWKSQFDGKNPKEFILKVTKDGGNVDAITAATISSRAVSEAIQKAVDGFEANKDQFMKGGNNE